MKWIPKWLFILAAIGVSEIILAPVSYAFGPLTHGFTGRFVDTNGSPLQGVFVLYVHKTDYIGPGGAVQHVFSGGILETDKKGRFHIPARFHLSIPLFETGIQPWVSIAYSPQTHSFADGNNFQKDWSDRKMNVHEIVLSDSSSDLKERAWALYVILETIHYAMFDNGRITRLKAALGVKERFVSTLRTECEFLSSTNGQYHMLAQPRELSEGIKSLEQDCKGVGS